MNGLLESSSIEVMHRSGNHLNNNCLSYSYLSVCRFCSETAKKWTSQKKIQEGNATGNQHAITYEANDQPPSWWW